jgi:prepilin-type N-terminal cleavage/methylation domain-containing protein
VLRISHCVFRPAWSLERTTCSQAGHQAHCRIRSTLHAAGSRLYDRRLGFTLLEIMIVVCIMGIVMTMGVPIVYKAWHKAPMSKAVSEIVEVCSHARALAILQGKEVDVVFHPHEGRFEVGSGAAALAAQSSSQAQDALPNTPASPGPSPPSMAPSASGSGLSGRLPDKVQIELMDINKLPHEFRDDDVAFVRFFPNGTCDELTLVLLSDQNERREITLEVTTGLPNVESDPRRFR